MKKGNVAPGLISKRVRFVECPNPDLSLQYGTIQGSYVEQKLMLVVQFDNGKIAGVDAQHVTVEKEEK